MCIMTPKSMCVCAIFLSLHHIIKWNTAFTHLFSKNAIIILLYLLLYLQMFLYSMVIKRVNGSDPHVFTLKMSKLCLLQTGASGSPNRSPVMQSHCLPFSLHLENKKTLKTTKFELLLAPPPPFKMAKFSYFDHYCNFFVNIDLEHR